jgi:hypothetical protein
MTILENMVRSIDFLQSLIAANFYKHDNHRMYYVGYEVRIGF